MKKTLKYISICLSLMPLFWILIFYSYVIRIALNIGRLPIFNNPQSGMHHGHFIFTSKLLDYVGYSTLLFLILLLVFKFTKNNFINKRFIYLWITGIVLVFFVFIIDPFNLMEWFAD